MRIGVDLGGTKIEAIALGDQGQELQRFRVATPRGEYDGTVLAIRSLVEQVEATTGLRGSVGVGIPGTIVAATGLVKNANSLWLNHRSFEADLTQALGREVRCANDANCFALSEATDGAAAGYPVVFGAILGTGCGGGVTFNGCVHAGPNGLAGEWGHIPLPWARPEESPGPLCYCGRYGCLETWISGTGLEQDFLRVTGQSLRSAAIVSAAAEGDLQAEAALARLESRIARGFAVLVDILDPDVLVVGGGLSNLSRFYTGALESAVAEHTFGGRTRTPILRNRHGDSSGVRGAAWLWPPTAAVS